VTLRLELTVLDEKLFKSELILLVLVKRLSIAFFNKGLVSVANCEETIGIVEVKCDRAE
jgi:hypothetical protein